MNTDNIHIMTNNEYTNILHKHPYQMCTKSVMDTTDPLIEFDKEGVCNHVRFYEDWAANKKPSVSDAKIALENMVAMLKKEGEGKEYDCIMGLSGGVDSSYLAYYATKVLGIRPLVVHVDTGWNSELAVSNIQNIIDNLGLDLHTLVLDWEEIKDLQLSFFKASLANLDVPQDHAFISSLYQEARKYNIKYILNGGNMATESILPSSWGYDASDPKHVLGVHKIFGSVKLKTYPIYSNFMKLIYYVFITRLSVLRPLELIDYNKNEAKKILINELGWRDYGGKHFESRLTKFFQAYYLPEKFGYDKRKAHLSSLIVSGQMTREQALKELELPLYNQIELDADKLYFAKKLGVSLSEFEEIMNRKPAFYDDYPNSQKLYKIHGKFMYFLSKCKKTINSFR